MSRYHYCPQDLRKSPNKKCEIYIIFIINTQKGQFTILIQEHKRQ